MTYAQETEALVASINKAVRDRDAWRGAGNQERYMEASSLVVSLHLQLQRLMTREHVPTAQQAAAPH